MGSKHKRNTRDFESDSYDDYDVDDDFDDLEDLGYLSKDFYSTDWEDPSGHESRFSTRRKIERRNDLKKLYSEFDEFDDFELGNDW